MSEDYSCSGFMPEKCFYGRPVYEKIIACCGLECTACAAYIATQENNEDLRKETAELWGRQLDVEVDPQSISCDGCLN